MSVIKKHLETLWKKFLRLRETDIRSKPLNQKGVGTPKTVIFETDSEQFPNTYHRNTVQNTSRKIAELFL